MKPMSPNKLQQRQRLSKSMKRNNKKVSPLKSLSAVDDKMKAVELGQDTTLKCNFCSKGPASDDLKSGKFYQLHHYSIHFFCLLFAFNGEQKGEDEEGLNGFLVSDVKTQVDKGKKHKCMYCDKPGAMSKCQFSEKKKPCGKWLHFPCGLEAGATFQFVGSMDVFCGLHRAKQSPELLAITPPDYDCVVCYDEVTKDSDEATKIAVPCCHRHFHRNCVQNMALASGKHHFKCPNCNNNEIYVDEIEKLGIYIPNADATWETEEHSAFYNYGDMYVQEKTCSADLCVCKEEEGRNFHEEDGEFEVVLCKFCGTAGCHVTCGKLYTSDPEFTCKDCKKETNETDAIEDLLNSESDESVGNSTIDLSSDGTLDLSSDGTFTGDENEEEDYSDLTIKFLNVHGEMTSSCLKCGHSIPAYKVGAMIEHIKSKHVKSKPSTEVSKNLSVPSIEEASTTSKSESSNIIKRLNQLLSDDDDVPVSSSSNNDDSFLKKFDESDELDKLVNSVSDGKEVEVEPTVESVIQNFDDENDELEMLLKEIEDGDGEDNVTEGVNQRKPKIATKENDVDAKDLSVLEDAHLKLQRLLEAHKSKVPEVEIPKSIPEEVNLTSQSLNSSVGSTSTSLPSEPVKPKYKPGPKSKKHKLAIVTPEPTKPILNSSEVAKVAIVKPAVKNASHMTNDVSPKESTMIFKNTSMKVIPQAFKQQTGESINIESLIKSTRKESQSVHTSVKDSTSEGKLASIKEKIAALQHKSEVASTSVSNRLEDDKNKQDLSTENLEPQPRYRPGPKSRKSKLIVDISEREASRVNADKKEALLVTTPSVSVEPKYKPGPKSRKINIAKQVTEVDMTEFDEIINEQNSVSKRSAEYVKPGPKSKKLKTQTLEDKIDVIDVIEKVESRANQESRRPSLKLVNINKLIESPSVKESSPCSWYIITTKPSSSFRRSVSTAATRPPPSVTPVPTSKHDRSTLALSLKSSLNSPGSSRRTPSPATISQYSQSVVRNQTPPPVVLNTPLPTIAEKRTKTPQTILINKSASKPKESQSSKKTNATGPLRSPSVQATKQSSKSVKTPSLNKTNPSVQLAVTNPTRRILAQISITPVSEISSRETSEISLPTPSNYTSSEPTNEVRVSASTSTNVEPSLSPLASVPSNPVESASAPTRLPVESASAPTLPPVESASASTRLPVESASASTRPPVESASASTRLPVESASASTRPPVESAPTLTLPPVEAAPAQVRRSKRPFSCPICNGNFKTLVILKTHLSNLHFHNRLLQRVLQNGSSFSCPEDSCPFQSNKKEDVTNHITDEHDLVFRIAKELFPNFTTDPLGSSAEKTSTSSDASKNDTPQTATSTESISSDALRISHVSTDPEVPKMTTTPISTATKRRSTESIEMDLKKQKMEKKTTRKVDLPMKPKINVQTATIRPLTRDIVSNKVSSPPRVNKAQEKLPQNVMIIPQTVMENGQLVMQQGQQYFLTQGILPQWAPAGVNNQPWMANTFKCN